MKQKFIERTVILIKPDAVKRYLIGEMLTRFEKLNFKVVAMKMVWVDNTHVGKHYKDEKEYLEVIGNRTLEDYKKYGFDAKEDLGTNDPYEIGKLVRSWNMDALSSGPLVAIILEGYHAVEMARKVVGSTISAQAAPGTIRGDYAYDTPILANLERRPIRTYIHASGNQEEAEFEIKLWFKEEEIYSY